jgi:AraC-like DNA-binding protein
VNFSETVPGGALIERIWFARGDGGPRETILPDGTFELTFNLGDPVLEHRDGCRVVQPRAMLVGETRRAVTIEPTGRVDFVGVRLRHGSAAAVTGAPLSEVRDRMLDLGDLHGSFASELHERLTGSTSDAARTELLVNVLTKQFRVDSETLAQRAAAAIVSRGGRLSISRLAAYFGVTVRTLSRAFDRAIGLTPKTLARVTRLNRAAALLRAGGAAADVALDAGFYDQSHLVNEFRALAGLSPARWLLLEPALAVHFLQDATALPD